MTQCLCFLIGIFLIEFLWFIHKGGVKGSTWLKAAHFLTHHKSLFGALVFLFTTCTAKMTDSHMFEITGNISANSTLPQALSNNTLEMLQSKMLQTALPVLYLVIFCVSVPFNSLSLVMLWGNQPWTPTVVFLLNLAITDLIYGITLPFQVIYHLRGNDWPFGDAFCSVATILFYGNMNCSIATMASISVERFVGIVLPLRFKKCITVRRALLTCLLLWALVLLVDLPLMLSKLTFHVEELHIVTCFDVLPKKMVFRYFSFYIAFRLILFFFFPLVIMGICYLSIIVTLLRSDTIHTETKRQTIHIILVLFTVFLVCYLPSNLLLIIHYDFYSKGKPLYIEYKLSLALSSLNCCLDPLVYFFGSKQFRQKVQHKAGCCTSANNVHENTMSYNHPLSSS
ncbi:P2Y purinoceptor 8-like isoform X1 [Xenopus laevis]|uniref:P2Y purinoceptor 8-like isoform X1 n=1 Tax=Xenopus laevis TaxID=8355 RepID=A0A8J0UHL2_XENLA|nr:P2Y purinoceptor 8-like isoform X1 [Xenopus laevis]